MLGELNAGCLRVDNALSTLPEGTLEERDDVRRLAGELVCKFLIVRYQMCNVDIAVVLFDKYILPYLVSINVCPVELKCKDELFQFRLKFCAWLDRGVLERCQYAQRVG